MSKPNSSKRRHYKKPKSNYGIDLKCIPMHGQPMSFDEIHRGCMDKARFHSRKTVRAAAKSLGFRYYRCRFCGEFHLTKSKGAIDPWKE